MPEWFKFYFFKNKGNLTASLISNVSRKLLSEFGFILGIIYFLITLFENEFGVLSSLKLAITIVFIILHNISL